MCVCVGVLSLFITLDGKLIAAFPPKLMFIVYDVKLFFEMRKPSSPKSSLYYISFEKFMLNFSF